MVATILILELWLIVLTLKQVRPLTEVCNRQDEIILDLDDEQPTCVVQPTPLEVVVIENHQNTMTFNEDQISVHLDILESESESD